MNDFKLTGIIKRKCGKSTQINTFKNTKIVSDGIFSSKFFCVSLYTRKFENFVDDRHVLSFFHIFFITASKI